MKKVVIGFILGFLFSSSITFAYVFGGTNFGFSGYPEFRGYLSYKPSKYDVESYIQDIKEYVANGDNDKKRITEEQNKAIEKGNDAVSNYNRGY